ncbi:hypothetical protein SAMN04487950_3296 [Halogranum rubrum]|uniref:DUF2795 domain-containing protein n=2 Tax=Halogranum rubrum TaxID=553466 RepID=A0A1I4GJ73_9EURY|nr:MULTISPECIES: hypothetical protein [Halogranum]EJN59846.1 hypothetical protein HSB1_20040 [Halogranum salarium B-1]SFL29231.1 hypothetical protein SAMN04487950_3296 [Halogranum rubrum]
MRLNGTGDLIDGYEYPATSEELIEAHGDHEIELADGSETLQAVLERLGSETYHGPQDLRDAVFTGVSHQAIGRRFYSDRDVYTLGETGPDPVSF